MKSGMHSGMRMSDHEFNRLTVLRHMRAAQPVSRTDLARLSGLNGGTITAIIRDLVERGLVVEHKVESPGRGRPRLNLSINPHGAYAVGATLSAEGPLRIDILDLKGDCVFSTAAELVRTTRLADLANQMAGVIGAAIAASAIPHGLIAQVGIGLPAIVDSRAGTVVMLETFEPGPFRFADAVADTLGIPVRLDNSNNLLARAVHWFAEGPGLDDFTLVALDLGLGAASYRQGQIVIGNRSMEAELGHVKIVPEHGRACHCGAFGCLQAYSSVSAIVIQYHEGRGWPVPSYFDLRAAYAELVPLVKSGDTLALEVMERAGRYLGIGLANHINMQDPARLVVLSPFPDLFDFIAEPFQQALERNTLPPLRDPARLTMLPLDATSYSRGAAAMVMEQLYQRAQD